MGTFEAAAEHRDLLLRLNLADYEAAMNFTGGRLVTAHSGRSVVEVGHGLFLKRFTDDIREQRRELAAMARLAAGAGPEPVPTIASGSGERGAFLLTLRPDDAVSLGDALQDCTGSMRSRLVREVAHRIRALHDRDLVCPDLFAHHLLVAAPGSVWLIDAGRLKRSGSESAKARDLAALELSLPYGAAGAMDRVRFLTAYLGRKPRTGESMLRRVEAAFRRLDRRRRHRTDRLVGVPSAISFLRRHGIATFDDLMAYRGEGANCLRKLPDRENWRVELGGRLFFVKRHCPLKGLRRTPAAREWEAIHVFRRAGIRAMHPFAYGEDLRKGSTIWVEAAPGVPLDDLLRDDPPGPRVRRELVREAAGILRTMRSREMHHRDMYACHLIADASTPAGRRLTVIDLQRAREKRGLRRRWYVKDVAQLLHSAPCPPVTATDTVRFLRTYFGVKRLGRVEKAFARRVLRKANRIR